MPVFPSSSAREALRMPAATFKEEMVRASALHDLLNQYNQGWWHFRQSCIALRRRLLGPVDQERRQRSAK
jgi:hypothetical protein